MSLNPEQILRKTEAGPPVPGEPEADCLTPHVLAAFAEGWLHADARSGVISHVAGCHRCRAELAATVRALADPAIQREAAAAGLAPGVRRWRRLAVWGAVAAAIVLVVTDPAGITRRDSGRDSAHRGNALVNGTAPRPLAPFGPVAGVPELRWARVPGADRYRVTLFDTAGRVRYEAEPSDPVAALPDSLNLQPGVRYLWRVQARIGFDRWVASELVTFSVGPERAP